MSLLDKYRPVFNVPDPAGANPDPVVVDPGIPPDPVVIEPEPDPEPQSHTVPLGVATGLRAKNRDLEAEIERLRREAADARALAERLSSQPNDPATPPAPRATPATPAANDDADVDRRAAAIVLNRDLRNVSESGVRAYGKNWDNAVNALDAYGVNTPDFLSSVMEISSAPGMKSTHEIMFDIAQDGEKAVALAAMTPARRISEITRMAMAASATATTTETPAPVVPPKPAPKTVSKAPPPAPAVTPSASKVVDWRQDESSDAEFDRGFTEMMEQRAKRGRR